MPARPWPSCRAAANAEGLTGPAAEGARRRRPHARAAFGLMAADPRAELARCVVQWLANRNPECPEWLRMAQATDTRRQRRLIRKANMHG